MKMQDFDLFEKILASVMLLVTILGFYYAATIYRLASSQIYDASIPTNVLLFLLVETSILNGTILYSLLKRREEK